MNTIYYFLFWFCIGACPSILFGYDITTWQWWVYDIFMVLTINIYTIRGKNESS